MKYLLKTKTWILFIFIYLIPIIQISTGFGIVAFGWIIGIFPSVVLYYYWLHCVLNVLDQQGAYRALSNTLIINIFLLLPLHNLLINIVDRDSYFASFVNLYGGVVFFILFFTTLTTWRNLSKSIYKFESNIHITHELIEFKSYKNILFYFIFGPFTFFILDCKIKNIIKDNLKL